MPYTQPPHVPTDKIRAEIVALRSYGVPIKEVAAYIGIDDKTMYKYYRPELEQSAMKANANVGKFLYQAASGQALKDGASYSDCVRAAMFWAKTRMGWKETDVHEHTGANGGAIQVNTTAMSAEEAYNLLINGGTIKTD